MTGKDLEIPIGKRTKLYRFFEMLPGILSYSMILAPFVLSFINPVLAAMFIIVYIISYFVKSIAMAIRTVQGYNTLQRAQRMDWSGRLRDLAQPARALEERSFDDDRLHQLNLRQLAATTGHRVPDDIYNAVIIATYNESRDILEPTIKSVMDSQYDLSHLILMIAYEERGGEQVEATAKALQQEYKHHFKDMIIVKHPGDLPHEVPGKGANITYAGYELQRYIENETINPDNVIVTTLDSDNRPHPSYFAYLTYEYIMHPDPRHAAFQPLTLFLNNIWDVPAPMRVVATGNSFWNIVNSLRPHMLRNFASHSQSLAALIDMNFWSVRTIVEDGHQFWRSYFRFDGDYAVVPIYVPIYQDAVLSDSYKRTLMAQFVQVRRWAYGASDIAFVGTRLLSRNRTVPLWGGAAKFVRLLEGHVSWASAAIIITFGAFGPLFINPEAARSVAAHQLPEIVSGVQRVAMLGIFVSVFISFRMLPPRPERYKRHRNIWLVLQWVLMPVTSLAYGAAAALNSQTRLLFGKYLERFDVTEKAVVGKDGKARI